VRLRQVCCGFRPPGGDELIELVDVGGDDADEGDSRGCLRVAAPPRGVGSTAAKQAGGRWLWRAPVGRELVGVGVDGVQGDLAIAAGRGRGGGPFTQGEGTKGPVDVGCQRHLGRIDPGAVAAGASPVAAGRSFRADRTGVTVV
jgi:hypothetical protein